MAPDDTTDYTRTTRSLDRVGLILGARVRRGEGPQEPEEARVERVRRAGHVVGQEGRETRVVGLGRAERQVLVRVGMDERPEELVGSEGLGLGAFVGPLGLREAAGACAWAVRAGRGRRGDGERRDGSGGHGGAASEPPVG